MLLLLLVALTKTIIGKRGGRAMALQIAKLFERGFLVMLTPKSHLDKHESSYSETVACRNA